ncbi:MAG: UvrD-helicase domain-containing protein [Bacteroidota bacterium]
MYYVADLHVHSHYSRATSKDLNLASLYQWANIKGIDVVGTGDFTHPQWFQTLQEELVPDGTGLYQLKNPPPQLCRGRTIDVRFCLTTEVSSIYKQGDKVRKNHNLLYAPDLETVAKLNAKLATIGNLAADGRPILGLPSRDLLEIVLESSDQAYLIPAHVWTPWFSTLGSKSGYDSIEACFRDLTSHIFALETGLSSDPAMNRRLSALDRYTMVSNSDAHSPKNLGREANLFDTSLTYDAMFRALKTQQGFLGTLEFFPEEGKYHMDGHRSCGVCLDPSTTQQHKGLCPTCGKALTIGVLHRVVALADRQEPQKPKHAADFAYIIPLPEIIAEIKGAGVGSKEVQKQFQRIIGLFGDEFAFLRATPIEEIRKQLGTIYAEAIRRLRNQQITPSPGYDGLYGAIRIFQPGELKELTGQLYWFEAPTVTTQHRVQPAHTIIQEHRQPAQPIHTPLSLNEVQRAIQAHNQGAMLVKAGPGTGKTHTLIQWIGSCLTQPRKDPARILAITFTNKAADEMKARLIALLGARASSIQVGTFHAIAYQMLQERYPELRTVYDTADRNLALHLLFPELTEHACQIVAQQLAQYLEGGYEKGNLPDPKIPAYAERYQAYLQEHQATDLSAIIQQVLYLWQEEPTWLAKHRARYDCWAVDELQDINSSQYQFIRTLGQGKTCLAIGDPDQAIYGFRGGDVRLFFRFQEDFDAQVLSLAQHYRATGTIVQAAQALIQHNTLRSGLQLQTDNPQGTKISLRAAANAQEEAGYVVDQIKAYVGGIDNLALGTPDTGQYTFADIAVLFRQRAAGQAVLTHLRRAGIPAHWGDTSTLLATPPFCVVADILRLYLHPADLMAFYSLLTQGWQWDNPTAQKLLANIHPATNTFPHTVPSFLSAQQQRDYHTWLAFYGSLPTLLRNQGIPGVIKAILAQYVADKDLDATQRVQQATLLTLARETLPDVAAFLRKMTLTPYTDVGRIKSEGIHLLTFHAAKGLEFPVVFIVGVEAGITPTQRPGSDLEEERRLFYVALTRAKQVIHLTYTQRRIQYGQEKAQHPSPFIRELPQHLLQYSRPQKDPRQQQKQQLRLF